jgi:putative pyruvate formate lyase activating enzyme
VPVVWNSSGYESVETLRSLEGLVQVYLPDYKYSSSALAKRYSAAEDYPSAAADAIREMFRQTGPYRLDADGLLVSGVLIRHLILPGEIENSMGAIDFVSENFPRGGVLFSLMSQYTPMPGLERFPALQRRVDAGENAHLIRYMRRCGIENGYWQEPDSATGDMIPAFDGTGL